MFSDIDKTVHKDNIVFVCEAGVMHGYEDNTFRPNASVTRGQLATIIANLIDLFNSGAIGDPTSLVGIADSGVVEHERVQTTGNHFVGIRDGISVEKD